ncbi:uncharacterized protein [Nothobranchius furzeri]|uniref:uncharacterized protein n=1 Tax=Nothobranchius furzeri TaxID=105023 RepID=UPI0039048648
MISYSRILGNAEPLIGIYLPGTHHNPPGQQLSRFASPPVPPILCRHRLAPSSGRTPSHHLPSLLTPGLFLASLNLDISRTLLMELMQQSQVKAEIQSLASIAPDFLTNIYLPNKLRYGGWV